MPATSSANASLAEERTFFHNDKVFGQARSPETLDKTLDAIHDRYGVAAPLGDFLYTSPAKALLADSTTGGWVGRETVDGQETDYLSFKDKGVEWEIWIPTQGDPLPVRGAAVFPDSRRLRKVAPTFKNWNLAPQVAPIGSTPTSRPTTKASPSSSARGS